MDERLQMLLSKLNPYAGHVLVVGRGDSKTLILGTANAGNRLTFISNASPLEHQVVALETEHFRAIEHDLVARFRVYADDGLGHWVQADFADVAGALEEYDLSTGARVRSANLSVGDRAYVKGLGKGEIAGFACGGRGDRVKFRSERLGKYVLVPRSVVKPVVQVRA